MAGEESQNENFCNCLYHNDKVMMTMIWNRKFYSASIAAFTFQNIHYDY